ncbi:hypothetical protein F511_13080 [Dorcoceras hygrometricum]|uniref:Uncharacterized protein n=1 Tax=Dorcoceras hygrometricum TaxID=472368 RepID=A0A2Z7DI76_9LAMI|nr:hypothetical protein F511_13080 [Dorcoceras hygrometricum]
MANKTNQTATEGQGVKPQYGEQSQQTININLWQRHRGFGWYPSMLNEKYMWLIVETKTGATREAAHNAKCIATTRHHISRPLQLRGQERIVASLVHSIPPKVSQQPSHPIFKHKGKQFKKKSSSSSSVYWSTRGLQSLWKVWALSGSVSFCEKSAFLPIAAWPVCRIVPKTKYSYSISAGVKIFVASRVSPVSWLFAVQRFFLASVFGTSASPCA